MSSQNFFQNIPFRLKEELLETLVSTSGTRIERIISRGQATPAGQWLIQDQAEWVMVLKGRAVLRFKGKRKIRAMHPGDYLLIPAGTAHRVEETAAEEPTIWLAVHYRT